MYKLLASVVLISCILEGFFVSGDDKYTTKYDNIDFGEIVASDRLLKNYVNCLMERGRCTPDASELKKVLPDALETDCIKCSEIQKHGIFKVAKHLMKNRTDWWNELESKYDPQRKYRERYREELEKEGVHI